MTIKPITDTTPACFGVCCPQHGQCARYAAVESAWGADSIATCDDDGTGQRPLFLQLQREEAEA
jgi:hypothetical protein